MLWRMHSDGDLLGLVEIPESWVRLGTQLGPHVSHRRARSAEVDIHRNDRHRA